MTNPFPAGLEPALVWKHFDAIRAIPRGSGNEAATRAHVLAWANKRAFPYVVDETGNILVRVPASPGCESRKTTVLQGHLDMVNEKNSDVVFDFDTEGINVQVVGDELMAMGTTLGADNGIGVACAMAIADDPTAVHGPLELFCTIDEETGMTGARGLKAGFLTGARMLNLDTEEEGYIYVGCAGGGDVFARFPIETAPHPADSLVYKIDVRGLVGGHSGCDIHLNRANALKCLARGLDALRTAGMPLFLSAIEGGSKHNAIPREAQAVVCLPATKDAAIQKLMADLQAELRSEFGGTDPSLTITASATRLFCEKNLTPALSDRIVDAILATPSCVLAMSRDVPGLVETSNNIGVVHTTETYVELVDCCRSSIKSALASVRSSLVALYRLAGATVTLDETYPGWKPDMTSQALATGRRVYQEIFGVEVKIAAVHAGLECGLIGEHFPGMEMISIGPDIKNPHSPGEKVNIPSVGKFYTYLKGLLAALD
jgi:dipeptidase D